MDLKNKILFAKLNERAIIPTKRVEDAGYDLYALIDKNIVLKSGGIYKFKTGICSAFGNEYVVLAQERGSTGTICASLRCGVIDSGYRGEWMIPINNTGKKKIVITNDVDKVIDNQLCTYYPASKAIAQFLVLPVPKLNIVEVTPEDIQAISSERSIGKLGSSGK